MSLSWGRGTDQPPPTRSPFPRWGFALLGAALVAGGVALAVFTQAGPANDTATRAAIDELLERRRAAYAARDLGGFMATVDPGRVFLRTCEEQRFAAAQRVGLPPPTFGLGRTDTYLDYVRAWVDYGGGYQRVFFRNDGARWYVSEPTSGELGEDRTREIAGVKVSYRDVESDVIDALALDLPWIIGSVAGEAPTPPAHLFSLRVATLTSTDGRCFVAGEAGSYGTTQVILRQVGLTQRYERLSEETTKTIQHEGLHWIQAEHSLRALGRADWWIVEGWPFLIADRPTFGARRYAVCQGTPPTFKELRLGPGPTTNVETTERYYIVASMLVERLYEEQRATMYWSLFDAFAGTGEPSPYVSVVGVDGPQMYAALLDAAHARYC